MDKTTPQKVVYAVIPLEQWGDKALAEAVREIALMADTDSLAPDRSRWAGVADILMTAADRIWKEE